MHNNQVADLNNLRVLSYNKNLTTIDFKGNAVSKSAGFRRLILSILPLVTNLDANVTKGDVEAEVSSFTPMVAAAPSNSSVTPSLTPSSSAAFLPRASMLAPPPLVSATQIAVPSNAPTERRVRVSCWGVQLVSHVLSFSVLSVCLSLCVFNVLNFLTFVCRHVCVL
jgi:hypothetical protein